MQDFKITDEMIAEFIGADLEPLEGNDDVIKTGETFTNPFPPKNGEDTPITGDTFAKQSNVPWWGRYYFGGLGIGFPYLGGGMYESVSIKEDNLLRNNDNGYNDVMQPNETVAQSLDVSNLTKLYTEDAIMHQLTELMESLSGLSMETKDNDAVKAIVLNYILDNINFESLDRSMWNILKNKLK